MPQDRERPLDQNSVDVADSSGDWVFHGHVLEHLAGRMVRLLPVT